MYVYLRCLLILVGAPRCRRTDTFCPYTSLFQSGQARSSCRAVFDQAHAHARPRAMRAVRVVAAFLLVLGRLAAAFIEADGRDRKSTRLNSSHYCAYRMPSSA